VVGEKKVVLVNLVTPGCHIDAHDKNVEILLGSRELCCRGQDQWLIVSDLHQATLAAHLLLRFLQAVTKRGYHVDALKTCLVVRISFELIEATFNTLAAASPLLGKLVCFPLAYFSPF